jgi:hypothetical protein
MVARAKWLGVLVASTIAALDATPAIACICVRPQAIAPNYNTVVSPNVEAVWTLGYSTQPLRLVGPTQTVVLRADGGDAGWVRYPLMQALEANADYRVAFATDPLVALSMFSTSSADAPHVGAAPPAKPVFADFAAGAVNYGNTVNSCNPGKIEFRATAQLMPDPTIARYEVAVGEAGTTVVAKVISAGDLVGAWSQYCDDVRVVVQPNHEVCIDVVAVDYAGQRSAPVQTCTRVRDCGTMSSQDAQALDFTTCAEPSGCQASDASTAGLAVLLLIVCGGLRRRPRR